LITVIDLNLGNIASIANALKCLGFNYEIVDMPQAIEKSKKLIFPGVGNFFEAAKRMRANGIDDIIRRKVLEEKIPILGICLGMQLLAATGVEGGVGRGLGLIEGRVSLHRAGRLGLRLPHIGWNDVHWDKFPLFEGINTEPCFYFVHSYEINLAERAEIAHCNYGVEFVAAFQKGHILGVQFHPEKSQEAGLQVLKNYCEGNY